MPEKTRAPLAVKILTILLFLFGLLAFAGSAFLWGEGFILNPPAGVDLAFPITDILVNAPASIAAAIGLWRMKQWGYVTSQFVAGFYIYASVEIFVHVAQAGPPYAVEIVAPQALAVLVAVALVVYLWRIRGRFD
ncbi:MAG: hypothetical protein JW918_14795 [Anaerolineae bacterium]|nr:hypothetical protein [Anaerolineae bacterium]